MQFTIKRDALLKSLTLVQGIIEKKNTLPILSNVLLDAMSCGKAVIGTNKPGINNVIIHNVNGVLCESDVSSLSSAITGLIKDEKAIQRLGAEARRLIIKNNSKSEAIKKEVNIYKNILTYRNKHKENQS